MSRPESASSHSQSTLIQDPHSCLKAVSYHGFTTNNIFNRDPTIVKDQFARVAATQTHFPLNGACIETGSALLHHKCGDPSTGSLFFIGHSYYGSKICHITVGDKVF